MRRQIIILLFVILLAVPASAQWPNSFIGEHMTPPQVSPVQMWLSTFQNPYGTELRVGVRFYFGSLAFDVCNGEDVAILNLDTTAARHCNNEQCYFYFDGPIHFPQYMLTWNPQAQSYLFEDEVKYGINVMAITVVDGEGGISLFQMGTMQWRNDLLFWDDTRPIYIYTIEPLTATEALPPPRRPSGRRARPE